MDPFRPETLYHADPNWRAVRHYMAISRQFGGRYKTTGKPYQIFPLMPKAQSAKTFLKRAVPKTVDILFPVEITPNKTEGPSFRLWVLLR